MPSSEDRMVGCRSLCMCIIREHLHIGAVALIGPLSDAELPVAPPVLDVVVELDAVVTGVEVVDWLVVVVELVVALVVG